MFDNHNGRKFLRAIESISKDLARIADAMERQEEAYKDDLETFLKENEQKGDQSHE